MNIRINWWALGEIVVTTVRVVCAILAILAVVGGVAVLLAFFLGAF